MQHKCTLCSSTELQRPKDGVHTSGGSGHRAAADGNTQWANVDHALACRDAAWQLVANDVQGRAKHLGRCRFAAGEQAGCACSAALMAVLLQQQVKSIRAPSPPPHTAVLHMHATAHLQQVHSKRDLARAQRRHQATQRCNLLIAETSNERNERAGR